MVRRRKTNYKYEKKYSTSLAIKELQITSTKRFYLHSVRMANFKKKINYKCLSGHRINVNVIYCQWDVNL
jgi:hypothetical protein